MTTSRHFTSLESLPGLVTPSTPTARSSRARSKALTLHCAVSKALKLHCTVLCPRHSHYTVPCSLMLAASSFCRATCALSVRVRAGGARSSSVALAHGYLIVESLGSKVCVPPRHEHYITTTTTTTTSSRSSVIHHFALCFTQRCTHPTKVARLCSHGSGRQRVSIYCIKQIYTTFHNRALTYISP